MRGDELRVGFDAGLLSAALLVALVACAELPPPPRGGGAGGAGGSESGGGGTATSGTGGADDPTPALPVCGPQISPPCATVTQVETGWDHTCVMLDDDTVRCWGANGFGQLGRGYVSGWEPPAVALTGQKGTLLVGLRHSCVLDDAGTLRCWGDNELGQLARDDLPFSATPIVVMENLASARSAVRPHARGRRTERR